MPPLRAIYDDDLLEFLKNLGVLHDIQAGRMRCKFCREPVTLETLLAVLPESGSVRAICSGPSCSKQLSDYAETH